MSPSQSSIPQQRKKWFSLLGVLKKFFNQERKMKMTKGWM
jgi:hypothetical protein